jgi:hypothetical protein
MKATKKATRILGPEDLPGAMMHYKPMNEAETAKVAAIIAKHRADKSKKQSKKLLQKVSS